MTVRRFRKKPVEIRAVEWTGENLDEITDLVGLPNPGDTVPSTGSTVGAAVLPPYVAPDFEGARHVVLTTAQGQQVAAGPGEWVVPDGRPGRAYPIAPGVFAATYDEITEESPAT